QQNGESKGASESICSSRRESAQFLKLGNQSGLTSAATIFCRISPGGGDILLKMTSDLDLLRRFARENSQDAFAEIVRRHLNLVYSAALRQVRSPQLAEEIAQSVFADLARSAG